MNFQRRFEAVGTPSRVPEWVWERALFHRLHYDGIRVVKLQELPNDIRMASAACVVAGCQNATAINQQQSTRDPMILYVCYHNGLFTAIFFVVFQLQHGGIIRKWATTSLHPARGDIPYLLSLLSYFYVQSLFHPAWEEKHRTVTVNGSRRTVFDGWSSSTRDTGCGVPLYTTAPRKAHCIWLDSSVRGELWSHTGFSPSPNQRGVFLHGVMLSRALGRNLNKGETSSWGRRHLVWFISY